MWHDETQLPIWKAGEIAPAGVYLRVDNASYRLVVLTQDEPLPASFDGQVALYQAAPIRNMHIGYVNRQQTTSDPSR